ncbi:hypothetical protein BpHYR1_039444 [Brachionus plicatilis]|uniref:Uncharacterized protein n=1 Tax=Brachionus plicatilis TaxID=10195 RepID=A0A3M7S3T9_BRAPC|nr:hypothetical protein BpHYR1_039444 [Brachionus plicatilis]
MIVVRSRSMSYFYVGTDTTRLTRRLFSIAYSFRGKLTKRNSCVKSEQNALHFNMEAFSRLNLHFFSIKAKDQMKFNIKLMEIKIN